MSSVALIWAQARGPAGAAGPGVIGAAGALPWHLPEDLSHFRALTSGRPVIMGRSTWESLPPRFRPLPGRANIVLTRTPDYVAVGAAVVPDVAAALALAGGGEAWVIGGSQVYAATIALADRLEVTEIDADVDGDAFAPLIGAPWRRAAGPWLSSTTGLRYRFVTWTRVPGRADAR